MSDIDDCRKSVERLTRDRGEVMRAGNDITQRLRAAVPKMPDSGTPIAWSVKIRSELLLEAAAEIDGLRAEVERHREALRWYADQRNYFAVERRRRGDPDPAVVFMELPPIMSDCGKRARKALEGKP